MQEEAKKQMMLEGEDLEIVKQACAEVGSLKASFDLQGLMDFDTYMKIFVVIVKLQVTLLKKVEDSAKTERATHLENKD